MIRHVLIITAFLVLVQAAMGAAPDYTSKLASLIDPAKLATLGKRGANPRIQKAVYWLATARENRVDPATVLDTAIAKVGPTNGLAASLTKDALLRNLTIAQRLGCLDQAGLAEMRHGRSPTVRTGPYKDQELSVDHIIPIAACPELDNVVANLELMPLGLNNRKSAKIGDRQRELAAKLHEARLLDDAGLQRILSHR